MILLQTTSRAVASVVLACAVAGCGRKDVRDSGGSDAGAAPVIVASASPVTVAGAPLPQARVPTRDAARPAEGHMEFRGTVAGAGVLLRINASDGAGGVEGEYRYDSQKQYLALRGTLDRSVERDGHLLLDERNGTRITGHFDAQVDDRALQGTWFDGDRVKQFPVSLSRWHRPPRHPVEIESKHIAFEKPARRRSSSGQTTCKVDISYEQVVGLPSKEVERKVNELLARDEASPETPCDEGYGLNVDREETWNGDGVLSVTYSGVGEPGAPAFETTVTYVVIDVQTGKAVQLLSCLVAGGEGRLRELLEARVRDEVMSEDPFFEEAMTAVQEEELPPFAVREWGLEFNFPVARHAGERWNSHPYEFGWAELRPLLAAKCPLAPLANGPVPADATAPDASR